MKTISIILSSLSMITVLFAIVFEGKLKRESRDSLSIGDTPIEIKKLSVFGWLLIILIILFSFGNGFVAFKNIVDNDKQYEIDTTNYNKLINAAHEDTIRYVAIIKQLKQKSFEDSINIASLSKMLNINGLKSDSIKLAVVDNAVKSFEKQRLTIEKQNDNSFIRMTSEVKNNLSMIIFGLKEDNLRGLLDKGMFTSLRLSNKHIEGYIQISSRKVIIDHLLFTSELIDKVNYYCDLLQRNINNNSTYLNVLIPKLKKTENALLLIYERVYNLESYNDYETTQFKNMPPEIDRGLLILYLSEDYNSKIKR